MRLYDRLSDFVYDGLLVSSYFDLILSDADLINVLEYKGLKINKLSVFKLPHINVDDSVLIIAAYGCDDELIGLIHLSNSVSPEQVFMAFKNARNIRNLLGSTFDKDRVLLPIFLGYVKGNSYSFTPVKKNLSSSVFWFFQRRYMVSAIADWLIYLAGSSKKPCSISFAKELLLLLQRDPEISESIRISVGSALLSLESKVWSPLHMADHNDFWKGNILVDSILSKSFFVIDWGGANIDGFGVHDMVTFCQSFKVSPSLAHKYLSKYSLVIDMPLEHLLYQYLLSMGCLRLNLSNFPYDRFIQKIENEFKYLSTILPIR